MTDPIDLEVVRARAAAALAARQIDTPEVQGGVITASSFSENSGTCLVHLDGDEPGTSIPASFLGPWVPHEGQRVMVLASRAGFIVLGSVGPVIARTWTPTVSGGTWALGNGSSSGTYERVGGWCHVEAKITFGSSSVFGGGTALTLGGLPVPARAGLPVTLDLFLVAGAGSQVGQGRWRIAASGVSGGGFGDFNLGAGANFFVPITSTVPQTWQNGNTLEVYGSYPV